MFVDRLIDSIVEKKNPTVVGLDPKIEYVPSFLREKIYWENEVNIRSDAEAVFVFNKKIIDAVYDLIPAVKLQLAYYELLGIEGLKTFKKTAEYAKSKGLIVIADGKRNDIGSTAQAYSDAYLGSYNEGEKRLNTGFNADALTVNPYLGYDGIKPFVENCKKHGRGIFVLVKTSNKSSSQLQDLVTADGKLIYEIVAQQVEEWGIELVGEHGYSSVGAVVGATYPQQAKVLRKIMKHAFFLVPGYGAQGATAEDVASSFDDEGIGAIVNASRSIMCAYKSDLWSGVYGEKRFEEASRAEVVRMRDDINKAIGK